MDCRPSQSRKKTGGAMSKTSVHRIFLGVLALMPAALFAQQAAQPKTKAAQGKTEEPQPKKEEAKKEEAKKEEARNDEAMKLTQEAAKDGRRREVDVRPRKPGARHVHFGQSGS